MKALKLLLAVALWTALLVPGATAGAQSTTVQFEPAESPDDTCDLRLNDGGPYEVSIAGSIAVIYENGSVVAVPQGARVNYLQVERTFGSTAVGINERCDEFVPSAEPEPASTSDGLSTIGIAVAGVAGLALLGGAAVLSKPKRG